jgi:serine/threonine-protein kinase HipA
MTFTPVTRLTVFYEPNEGQRQVVGRLLRARHDVLFEFDPAFIATGLQLAPFTLPLRPGVVRGDPRLFDGVMGLFDDSLPDGWGRLLIDRRARQQGYSGAQLGPLDRLSLVGARSMGALVYEPEQLRERPTVLDLEAFGEEVSMVLADDTRADYERLFAIGGSPHGARPKALVQIDRTGTLHAGATHALPNCTPWLVKFPSRDDAADSGALELAYGLMAKAAGLAVPETRLLARTYFATRRFDRDGTRKVHMLTLAGLLDAPHTTPSVTYVELLRATRSLVKTESAVREMFRRACFNVFAHNRDDHSKNFSFLMNERGQWSVSPAYDVSYSDGPGGEHWMLVAGEGANPGRGHLEELARRADLKRVGPIIDEVRNAVDRFATFADEARVPVKTRARIARALGVSPGRVRARATGVKRR